MTTVFLRRLHSCHHLETRITMYREIHLTSRHRKYIKKPR